MSLTSLLCSILWISFGYLLPCYRSFKAIRTKDFKKLTRLLVLWIVIGLFSALQPLSDLFLSWFPFYYEIKFFLILFLLFPEGRGAIYLYKRVVLPFLVEREEMIDSQLYEAQTNLGAASASVVRQGSVVFRQVLLEAFRKGQDVMVSQVLQGPPATSSPSSSSLQLEPQRHHRSAQETQSEIAKITEIIDEGEEEPSAGVSEAQAQASLSLPPPPEHPAGQEPLQQAPAHSASASTSSASLSSFPSPSPSPSPLPSPSPSPSSSSPSLPHDASVPAASAPPLPVPVELPASSPKEQAAPGEKGRGGKRREQARPHTADVKPTKMERAEYETMVRDWVWEIDNFDEPASEEEGRQGQGSYFSNPLTYIFSPETLARATGSFVSPSSSAKPSSSDDKGGSAAPSSSSSSSSSSSKAPSSLRASQEKLRQRSQPQLQPQGQKKESIMSSYWLW